MTTLLLTDSFEFATRNTPFALSAEQADGLHFWKELIYVGDFEKGELKFSVNDTVNKHWHNTIQEFKKEGIEIPVPVGHTTEPDAKRGTLIDSKIGTNEAGKQALYGLVKFNDAKTAEDFKNSNTSIYVERTFKSGTGKEYRLPIRHVALTDYPIIPGLAPFKQADALAASFADTLLKKDSSTMKLLDLARKYKIENCDKMTEDELSAALDAKLSAPAVAPAVAPATDPVALSHDKPKIQPVMLKLLKDNREGMIAARITSGQITPAMGVKLREKYLTDAVLSLAFDDKGDLSTGAFEDALSILDLAPKAVQLSHGGKELPKQGNLADNPLIKNAEARAATCKR